MMGNGKLRARGAGSRNNKVLKSRDITLLTKVHLVKDMVFPVVMYVRAGPSRKLRAKELILLNCGAGEDS